MQRVEFTHQGGGTYLSSDRNFETITEHPDGTYTWLQHDQMAYVFDPNGLISSIQDRNGNALLFTYDPAGKLPVSGISPYSNITTPIVVAMDWRLARIDEYSGGLATGRHYTFTYNSDGRLTKVRDSNAREITLSFDPLQTGNLFSIEDPEGNLHSFTYDTKHRMITFLGVGCASCSLRSNTYDDESRVTRQQHGSLVINFNYLVPGQVTETVTEIHDDETGALINARTERYEFNEDGFTTQYTVLRGGGLDEATGETDDLITVYQYNSINQLTSEITPRGSTITYTYDAQGNIPTIAEQIDGTGNTRTTAQTFDTANQLTERRISVTNDTSISLTRFEYDTEGNLIRQIRVLDESEENPIELITTYTYTSRGDLETEADPRGNVIQHEYNDLGYRIRTFDPAHPARQTQYEYDSAGNQTAVIDPRGNRTEYTYDTLGRLTKVTNPLLEETIYTYTGANLTQIEEGKTATSPGQVSRFEFDALNRRTAIWKLDEQDAPILQASFTFDSEGKVLSTSNGLSHRTRNEYDELGRLIKTIDPLTNETSFEYDKSGNATKKIDPELKETQYSFDYLNRLTTVTDAASGTTTYTHDAKDQVTQVTDAKSYTTTFAYDRGGRLIKVTNPLTFATQYEYDANDNLTKRLDANAHETLYTYDSYDQLKTITYPVSGGVEFFYDDSGNLTSYGQGAYQASYTFDKLNRLETVTQQYPGFEKVISYTYDSFNNRKTMTDPEGIVTTYSYDRLNRLKSISHSTLGLTSYSYDNASRLESKTLPNGVVTEYSFDEADRLKSLVTKNPNQVILSQFDYTFDKSGNRLSRTTLEGTTSYTYDDLYQLKTVSPEAESFTYDPVGNRLTDQRGASYTYDEANRLLSRNGTTYPYDKNGNQTSDGTYTYTYDEENRLTEVTENTAFLATYTFDPFGNRLSKTVSGATAYYLYDEEDILAAFDSTGNPLASITHGPGIDEPIALHEPASGATYHYILDGLGSIDALTNTTPDVEEQYRYASFGSLTILNPQGQPQSTSSLNPLISLYTFTAREHDPESGLYYYRARYYNPILGRFTQEDPLSILDTDLSSPDLNRYLYTRNNPINFTDPHGLTVAVPTGPGTGPVDIRIGTECSLSQKGARKWTCEARCNVHQLNRSAKCPDRVFGTGYGKTREDAWQAAVNNANSQVPRGCQKKHCHGPCSKT
ncbi:MAG: hypothetical protein A3G87_00340 [Omnitrophica bacterium RIFCSPLOWO2_12_FULL_50_11]|nr:MAG: hypothetical protein A3G87_00340 [Omnitrophica bacterium RIFCSPLOWO2_12_FULL_50_11]